MMNLERSKNGGAGARAGAGGGGGGTIAIVVVARLAMFCMLGIHMGWICQANGIRTSEVSNLLRGRGEAIHQQRQQQSETAVFAMGSFWRAEAVFGCLPGVLRTKVGYCGGTKVNPDYQSVGDHAESVQVEYDPSIISYEQLLDVFWSNHDPLQIFGQGPDVGEQYRSVIYIMDEKASEIVRLSKEKVQRGLGDRAIPTVLQPISTFYSAEAEHQKFELKRKASLMQLLGDLSDEEVVTSTIGAKLNGYAAGLCPKSVHKLIAAKLSPVLRNKSELLRLFGD